MLKIGLLGLGTVGQGVFDIINKYGDDFLIKKVLINDESKQRNIDKNILTTDPNEILCDEDIDIIVEVLGGIDTPYQYIKDAFKNKKHVITANKAVVAKYYDEFQSLAKDNNKYFLFEASVAGGIPILENIENQIKFNDIKEIKGILNGTSNFILSQMEKDKIDFKEALNLAQEFGYAEKDPTDDIMGYDIRRKIFILSRVVGKDGFNEEDIYTEGIDKVKDVDINFIKNKGFTIKLIATADFNSDYDIRVEPSIIRKDSIIGAIDGEFNIVSFYGSNIGESSFIGKGAGKFPTGNSIVRDLYRIKENKIIEKNFSSSKEFNKLKNNISNRYFIRISNLKDINKIDKLNEYKDILETLNLNTFIITKEISLVDKKELIKYFESLDLEYFIAKYDV